MKNGINPVLALGIILNFANLMFKHLHVYERLNLSDKVQGFLSGAVCAFLLLGLLRLGMGEEKWQALSQWKNDLFPMIKR